MLGRLKASLRAGGIAAGLALATCVFLVLTLCAALGALYIGLAQRFGMLEAMAVIGILLLVVTLVLALAAWLMAKGVSRPWRPARAIDDRVPDADLSAALASLSASLGSAKLGSPLALGLLPLLPAARDAAGKAVASASHLMRHGDRQTMLGLLIATALAGYVAASMTRRK